MLQFLIKIILIIFTSKTLEASEAGERLGDSFYPRVVPPLIMQPNSAPLDPYTSISGERMDITTLLGMLDSESQLPPGCDIVYELLPRRRPAPNHDFIIIRTYQSSIFSIDSRREPGLFPQWWNRDISVGSCAEAVELPPPPSILARTAGGPPIETLLRVPEVGPGLRIDSFLAGLLLDGSRLAGEGNVVPGSAVVGCSRYRLEASLRPPPRGNDGYMNINSLLGGLAGDDPMLSAEDRLVTESSGTLPQLRVSVPMMRGIGGSTPITSVIGHPGGAMRLYSTAPLRLGGVVVDPPNPLSRTLGSPPAGIGDALRTLLIRAASSLEGGSVSGGTNVLAADTPNTESLGLANHSGAKWARVGARVLSGGSLNETTPIAATDCSREGYVGVTVTTGLEVALRPPKNSDRGAVVPTISVGAKLMASDGGDALTLMPAIVSLPPSPPARRRWHSPVHTTTTIAIAPSVPFQLRVLNREPNAASISWGHSLRSYSSSSRYRPLLITYSAPKFRGLSLVPATTNRPVFDSDNSIYFALSNSFPQLLPPLEVDAKEPWLRRLTPTKKSFPISQWSNNLLHPPEQHENDTNKESDSNPEENSNEEEKSDNQAVAAGISSIRKKIVKFKLKYLKKGFL